MAHVEATPVVPADLPRFAGRRTAMLAGAVVGVIGLALTALGAVTDVHATMLSYLTAFVYWLGIALGGLLLTMIFHAAGARWMIVLRRGMEAMAGAIPLFVVLFIPIVLGAKHLFVWADPPQTLPAHELHLIHEKHGWLNLPFFAVRGFVYLAVFVVLQVALTRWSVRQDETGAADLTLRQRKLASVGLPFIALAMTFAAFDWLMSLSPTWFSTMFGVYYFAGSFLGAICLLVLLTTVSRTAPDGWGRLASLAHFHNLGKLMLAFTAFWAYIAYSQYMLIWVSNLPEEIPWYITRQTGFWRGVAIFLALGHFVVPFFALLSRDLKLRPELLSIVAIWLLLVHYVDLYWVIFPSAEHAPVFHWTQLTAFAGVGGLALAFGLFRLRGLYAVPLRDPFITDSLRYAQP
jgi:hypothetical protein